MSIKTYVKSSLALQQLFTLSGFGLILAVFSYLTRDLLLYMGAGPYNLASRQILRLGLSGWLLFLLFLSLFVLHLFVFFKILQFNREVRPFPYRSFRRRKNTDRIPSIYLLGAFFIVTFVVWHLSNLSPGVLVFRSPGVALKNINFYAITVSYLSDPYHAGVYFYSLMIFGILFIHHIRNFVQTFGIFFPPYAPEFNKGTFLLGLIFIIAFGLIPFYVLYLK